MYVDQTHSNWDEFLAAAISAYNTSKHSSSKYSPYEANFGREPIILADVLLNSPVAQANGYKSVDDYVDRVKESVVKINSKVNEHLIKCFTWNLP